MEAVAGITERMWQIQTRIAQVSAPRAEFDAVLGEAVLAQDVRLTSARPTTSLDPAALDPAALGWSTFAGVSALAGVTSPDPSVTGSGASRVDASGVPVELAAYGNGRIPDGALSAVADTSHRLWEPAARSLESLRAAAAADGVTIGITDSYRTYESQVDLVERKGLYSQGGLAATPGTSMHGWGVAVDLQLDPTAQAWMRTNAGRFGFVENVPREPWHWQYVPTH